MIEHFVVVMYERTCPQKTIDKCRKYLFTQMNRTMDNCPPTRETLLKHVLQGMSQSDIWARCMTLDEPDQNLADSDWFVDDKDEQQPVWTTLPKA